MNKISSRGNELGIFIRATERKQQNQMHQSPFGLSFKGKVLTADVFESSQATDATMMDKVKKNSNRLYQSMKAGVLSFTGSTNDKFKQVIGFAQNIQSKVTGMYNTLLEKGAAISFTGIVSKFRKNSDYKYDLKTVSLYMTKPVTELREMMLAQEHVNS